MEANKQAAKPTNASLAARDASPVPARAGAQSVAPVGAADGKKKKKKKKGLGKIIAILLILIIIGGAVLCYMMNYFGVKTMVVAFFITQDDQYATVMRTLTDKQAELEGQVGALDARAAELDLRETELDKKQTSINSQQESITKQKSDLANEKKLLQDVILDRAEVISIINSMSADKAAEMLENYRSIYEVAAVLAEIDMKKAAKIIEAFTPAMSARITEQMLSLSDGAAEGDSAASGG